MEQAIADAGLSPEAYQNNPRVGLIAGSGGGSRVSRCSALTQNALARAAWKVVGPYVVTKAMASRFARLLLCRLKFMALTTPSAPRVRLPHTVSVTQ